MLNNLTHMEKNQRTLLYIFASTILLYFIFAPAINFLYYGGDDFRYAFGGFRKSCRADDGFEFMLTLGRPLQAYMDCAVFKFAYTLERMKWIRIFAVILMGLGIGLLAEWLCCLGFSVINAFLAAACILLVRNLYMDTILSGAISLPFAILFALLAYRYIEKFHLYNSGNLLRLDNVRKERIKAFAISALLLLSSMLTYPAMAFFFATIILSKAIFSNFSAWEKTKREITLETILFCFMCIIYFAWAYINMHYFPQAPVSADQYHLDRPNFSLGEVFARIFILGNVFNPSWSFSNAISMEFQGWIVIVLLTMGISLGAVYFTKSNTYLMNRKLALTNMVQAIFATIALILLSWGFELVIPNRDMGGRLLMGVVAAGYVLVFWSIRSISLFFPSAWRQKAIFTVFTIVFILLAQRANIYTAAGAFGFVKHINYVKTEISNYINQGNKLSRIHYIISRPVYPHTKFFLSNEALEQVLGRKNYKVKWCSLARGTTGSEQNHQKEALACINHLPMNTIAITYTYPGEVFRQTDSMLIIDLQNISAGRFSKEYIDLL